MGQKAKREVKSERGVPTGKWSRIVHIQHSLIFSKDIIDNLNYYQQSRFFVWCCCFFFVDTFIFLLRLIFYHYYVYMYEYTFLCNLSNLLLFLLYLSNYLSIMWVCAIFLNDKTAIVVVERWKIITWKKN